MLEYRHFPWRTSLYYLLYAPAFAYFLTVVVGLIDASLFPFEPGEHLYLLGVSSGIGAMGLLLTGLIVDRTRRTDVLMALSSLIPVGLGMTISVMGSPNLHTPVIEYALAAFVFFGFGTLLVSWTNQLTETVVVRFRARVVGAFLVITLLTIFFYDSLGLSPFSVEPTGILLEESIAAACVFIALAFRPWRWEHHPLAVRGKTSGYFYPMVLILGAHILWYFSTLGNIAANFDLAGESWSGSIAVESDWELYQPLMLVSGILVGTGLADTKGRKTAFSFAVLLVGLLSIFGSATYGLVQVGSSTEVVLHSGTLLVGERFVEGYLLGLCALLIWGEIGMPQDRAFRISLVWLFFLGYMALFWAVDLHAFGWGTPVWVIELGREFAIVLSLVGLYWSANLPEILGREIEMEELELDFDDEMVEETVEAFVEADDFESIRSQLEIIDTAPEISDNEMSEILGEEFNDVLPMRRIPGIGPAMEKRLRKAGYASAAQLAGEIPSRLASKVKGMSEKGADKIVRAARSRVKEKLDSENSKD
ncbi:helix-hairpin-helix domain-containing protein [Candidatus Thorarchaeota archaeon]|nr:MAG: helix-hairpin-helix domain-containing protein [Candidatus Thorarchaeota archaeon]